MNIEKEKHLTQTYSINLNLTLDEMAELSQCLIVCESLHLNHLLDIRAVLDGQITEKQFRDRNPAEFYQEVKEGFINEDLLTRVKEHNAMITRLQRLIENRKQGYLS